MELVIRAVPGEGFVFAGWAGDLAGTENPVTLRVDKHTVIGANFVDVAPPEVAISSPVPGNSTSGLMTLSGTASDNAGIVLLRWSLNGRDQGPINVDQGRFTLERPLEFGENRIVVTGRDLAGNESTASVVVNWTPEKILQPVSGSISSTSPTALATPSLAVFPRSAIRSGSWGAAFSGITMATIASMSATPPLSRVCSPPLNSSVPGTGP
jgi:hypothetical protein